MTKLVILESPYAGDVEENVRYARLALRDCLLRYEAPLASHLLYTQPEVLDDNINYEREMGIQAGWNWMEKADYVVVYLDRGVSPGMLRGIRLAQDLKLPIYTRVLPGYKEGPQ